MKFLLVFITLFMSIGINLPDNVLTHLGFDPDYLKAGVLAFIITGMIISHRIAMVALVCLLSIGANLPTELLQDYGISRDPMIAALAVLVLSPWFYRHIAE